LEIEARRMAQIGVGGAGEAIGTAMLATAIGVDRTVEADIGTVVAGDDSPGALDMLDGLEQRQRLDAAPAIVEPVALMRLEPAGTVGLRAAAANALGLHQFAPDQIGVAAAAQAFEGFERGGLIKGHFRSPDGARRRESPLFRRSIRLTGKLEHNKNNAALRLASRG